MLLLIALLATLLIGQSSRWMQRWPVDDLLAPAPG